MRFEGWIPDRHEIHPLPHMDDTGSLCWGFNQTNTQAGEFAAPARRTLGLTWLYIVQATTATEHGS